MAAVCRGTWGHGISCKSAASQSSAYTVQHWKCRQELSPESHPFMTKTQPNSVAVLRMAQHARARLKLSTTADSLPVDTHRCGMRDGSNMAMRTSSLTELRAAGDMAVTASHSSHYRRFRCDA